MFHKGYRLGRRMARRSLAQAMEYNAQLVNSDQPSLFIIGFQEGVVKAVW